MGPMVMVLKRSAEQQQALDRLVAEQNDPGSPNFHKWLTPEEFGQRFGVAEADIESVTSYLAQQGFTVTGIAKNRMAVEFTGTAGQVKRGLGTEIHTYVANGQRFHANAGNPQIPAALAPVVAGIASMNSYRSTPTPRAMQAQYDPATHTARPLYSDPVNNVEAVTPGDLAAIYDNPGQYNGAGVSVGVLGDSNIDPAYIANYQRTFGLPANLPTVVVNGADPGITQDAILGYEQIELINAVAPRAAVRYYVAQNTSYTQGVFLAALQAVDENAVQVLSVGYESCEQALGLAGNTLINGLWEQAAAQGISVLVESGSGGSADCDVPANGQVSLAATQGLAVNGFASTPWDTAVGATDFYYGPAGTVTGAFTSNPIVLKYWNSSNTGYTSARGYIPEQAWNASMTATNQVAEQSVVIATGSGRSRAAVPQNGGLRGYSLPPWQAQAAGATGATTRVLPDVSFFGGIGQNGSAYALCTQATDCTGGGPGSLTYTLAGGTTGASAAFSGVAALLIQARGAQGYLNPILYSVAGASPGILHDVTEGTSTVVCAAGSPDCVNGFEHNSHGQIAYAAGANFDMATGLGSVDIGKLLAAWTGHNSGPLQFSPSSLSFAGTPVGQTSPAQAAVLRNTGATAISLSGISHSAQFDETNNCPPSLGPGASCTITVSFAPSVAGPVEGSVSVGSTPNALLSLSGIGTGGAPTGPITLLPRSRALAFYHQIVDTTSTPQTVTLINNQAVPLVMGAITSTPDFPIQSNCVGSIAPNGGTCTIQVSFDPQAVGSRSGTLLISSNGPGNPYSVALSGTGIQGAPGVMVDLTPTGACVGISGTLQFTATVSGTTNTAVNWYVDNTYGGNSSFGTISPAGLYTAPAKAGSHSIKAVSQDPSRAYAATEIGVSANPGFGLFPYTASVPVNAQQTFEAQGCGNSPITDSVGWSVDGIAGGNATVGTVTSAGVYTAPGAPGTHVITATNTITGQTATSHITVTNGIMADFGSRASAAHPIPANLFGFARGESMHDTADASLIASGGVTSVRLYAAIETVYATPTPNWTSFDARISLLQAAGLHVILQMARSPAWLQPSPNPCATAYDAGPTDPAKWGQIAASYVAHMDAKFPGLVEEYEIWNEPDVTLCGPNKLTRYLAIYAAAAPLMKQQASADGVTIRVGGPAASGMKDAWVKGLLTNPATAPYVDFVSYHQYLLGPQNVNGQWDTYSAGGTPLYQKTQEGYDGAAAEFRRAYADVAGGTQPLGLNTPVEVTEYNTNWSFYKDCCRNDPTYAPLWNALYVTDLFDTIYSGAPNVPGRLVYFAGNAYPWFCLVGVLDTNMDCEYSLGSTPQPYPQYYTYQLLASPNYLGLANGGVMASNVSPQAPQGGLAATAFYTPQGDALLIVNPTGETYSQVPVNLYKVGFTNPQATLYQIVNGQAINSSSLSLTPESGGFLTNISIPPYSVQAISLKGQ
jgi:hypothetical protein